MTLTPTLHPSHGTGAAGTDISSDVAYLRTVMVNLFFVGPRDAGDRGWVLVDAGLQGSAGRIAQAAAERFGANARPSAIVLTHGHFDHVGALRTLADQWDVPIYAHEMELPYLTGRSSYPPPDPTVGGGAMAVLSPLYPKGPFDVRDRVRALPDDRSVPGMPGWTWVPTPGHSPGHVSLFRESDRMLLAGDAFVTTKQESAIAVLMQRLEIHGPPMYFTPDWESARRSVERLASLQPAVVATGHGVPLRGPEIERELRELVERFEAEEVPSRGRYVGNPAVTDEQGIVSLPPATTYPMSTLLMGAAALLVTSAAVSSLMKRRESRRVEARGSQPRTIPRIEYAASR
jgi:glyoxylase-like metal-dependent hydrolase (beta-lactamase superfamily II)